MRRLAGGDCGLAGALRERRIDAAGVQPAHTELAEDVVKVKILRAHLRNCRIRAVRATDCAAHAEAALRKVESVSASSADAVRLHHADKIRRDAALLNEINQKLSDLIVRKCRDDRRL